jgi:AcrR family transcriptional regulator
MLMVLRQATTAHGQATRKRIIEVTTELVCRKGFAGTSVREVCEAVGVAKTALYWHFGSKSGLMAAVIEMVTTAWLEDFQSIAGGGGTPQDALDGLLAVTRGLVVDRSELLRIMILTVMEQGTVDPEIVAKVRILTDQIIETIGEGFTKALGIQLPDMDLLGHTIIALTHAALRRRIMDPETDLDRLFKDFERTIDLLVADRLRQLSRKKK